MGNSVFGHRPPTAGFEVPLEMLSACHFRIERQCETLRRLLPHLADHGADDEARAAAAGVVRYFDTSAMDHHADEEEELFPALIESMAGSDPVCIREMTSSLVAEHRELEALWRRLRKSLQAVVAGEGVTLDADTVQAFASLYARHIEREEKELLPMAGRLLGDEELGRIGRAMRERRGIDSVD
ncbi:MAG: hemerythrin domain-containing protein [Pseudomonadota bacterium]|nr:hemerythrin domain-containing protein [Pseudomonadota bacterium]